MGAFDRFRFRCNTFAENVNSAGNNSRIICQDLKTKTPQKTMDNRCLNKVSQGFVMGGAVGTAIGAVWGTYEAVVNKVPGLLKVRYIGQKTVTSAAVFGLFLSAGSLLHCGKR
ncbi:hypothetical protein CYMTET_7757 [Cymbomonas tetramitiformis]|uniref:Reactive oxygen species modulator 1 n=1 Tax=Cymbomonas tetramitiformis TaxID=36881 RepID=A0AAE0G0N2_9CHLO|nr:hypothetical protein CYMTET_22387 [Cymbomonas tetramitiformis]KAK3284601.1 hypothetical protein CYMTET_7757 [Cymbomonas tetramitiformis]